MNFSTAILILVGLILIPGQSNAAGFDCGKAVSRTEKLVCSDPELSKLDAALAQIYDAVRTRLGMPAVRDQRKWLLMRDECKDKNCLKFLYEYRVKQLSDPHFAPRVGTGTEPPPSYFSDAPSTRSIDELIEGCFADRTCADYAAVLIPRFSKGTHIPEDDVRETLKRCSANQRAVNVCAVFQRFALENEFADTLVGATAPAGEACEAHMEKRQVAWEKKVWAYCDRKAYREIGWGTARSGVLNACESEAFKKRIRALKIIGDCVPCSKCLNLP